MRRLILLLVAALLLATIAVYAQDIACTPTVPLKRQHRTNLKHRDPAASNVDVNKTSVAKMLKWAPPEDVSTPQRRRLDAILTGRESQVFTLEGDLWRAKVA
ncbi:MAG: hypothetical protein LAO21_05770 [Acidobacteriia bacterium]|nr:hypothetical protein [Terriglobia bacterium]